MDSSAHGQYGEERKYYEQSWHWCDGHTRLPKREILRLTETVASLPAVNSIVDLGAGDGRLLRALEEGGSRPDLAVAVERSKIALSFAPGIRVAADAVRIPLRDLSASLVTVCEVIEHLPVGVYGQVLEEVERVARDYIVVSVPNREDLARGFVRCPHCQCVYHRHRHLRSFDRAVLSGLFPAFDLLWVKDIGPGELMVPRPVVRAARRVRILAPGGAAPLCPQCGGQAVSEVTATANPSAGMRSCHGVGGAGLTIRSQLQRFVTILEDGGRARRLRKVPWLLAGYRRRT